MSDTHVHVLLTNISEVHVSQADLASSHTAALSRSPSKQLRDCSETFRQTGPT
jgi:hypothetical protein